VALQIACGIGLWKLKGYGRTIQLVFAWIGLIGFPIGTVISILILVYLFKPGIKILFSGKPAGEMTGEEFSQAAAMSQGSAAAVIIVVVVAAIGGVFFIAIIAAIAVPGLLRARMAGNEASAIGSLRAINSAEATYSSSCAAGGYAVALEDLARPPAGRSEGFVSPDLGTTGVAKSGYRFTLAKNAAPGVTDSGTAASTCNGSASAPATSFFAVAEPITPGASGMRYFATDARGIVVTSRTPISNPIVDSSVTPIQ
jgi:type IV pilus assembly protein PilA